MNSLSVKPPTIPIPFHNYLKVVAIVDAADLQTKQLVDHIAAENFEIEITDRFDRDVLEDADVGAYIAFIDGDRAEKAQAYADHAAAFFMGVGNRPQRAVELALASWKLRDTPRSRSILAKAMRNAQQVLLVQGSAA